MLLKLEQRKLLKIGDHTELDVDLLIPSSS